MNPITSENDFSSHGEVIPLVGGAMSNAQTCLIGDGDERPAWAAHQEGQDCYSRNHEDGFQSSPPLETAERCARTRTEETQWLIDWAAGANVTGTSTSAHTMNLICERIAHSCRREDVAPSLLRAMWMLREPQAGLPLVCQPWENPISWITKSFHPEVRMQGLSKLLKLYLEVHRALKTNAQHHFGEVVADRLRTLHLDDKKVAEALRITSLPDNAFERASLISLLWCLPTAAEVPPPVSLTGVHEIIQPHDELRVLDAVLASEVFPTMLGKGSSSFGVAPAQRRVKASKESTIKRRTALHTFAVNNPHSSYAKIADKFKVAEITVKRACQGLRGERWREGREPLLTPEDNFWSRVVEKTNGCWLWTGSLNGKGYGSMYADGKSQLVHRIAYQHSRGPIPRNHDIDHLCKVRHCCNPAHLEAVSHRENMIRAGVLPNGKLTPKSTALADTAGRDRAVVCHVEESSISSTEHDTALFDRDRKLQGLQARQWNLAASCDFSAGVYEM